MEPAQINRGETGAGTLHLRQEMRGNFSLRSHVTTDGIITPVHNSQKEHSMMRYGALLVVLALACAVSSGYAQDSAKAAAPAKSEMKMAPKDKEMTVAGEVVDVSCYLRHGDKGMGDSHAACAAACAKAGSPLGILTKDGKLYVSVRSPLGILTKDGKLYVSVLPDDHSTGPNTILMDHVAHQVEATGVVRTKGGVRGIMITKVEMAKPAEVH